MGMHAPPYTYMDMAVTPGYIYPVHWGNVMQSLTYGQVSSRGVTDTGDTETNTETDKRCAKHTLPSCLRLGETKNIFLGGPRDEMGGPRPTQAPPWLRPCTERVPTVRAPEL